MQEDAACSWESHLSALSLSCRDLQSLQVDLCEARNAVRITGGQALTALRRAIPESICTPGTRLLHGTRCEASNNLPLEDDRKNNQRNGAGHDTGCQLDEAAAIDGLTRFQTFATIILPLAVPALVTTRILVFIFSWNEVFRGRFNARFS
jgi:Binding-protein-dependent transport system inner membrane component